MLELWEVQLLNNRNQPKTLHIEATSKRAAVKEAKHRLRVKVTILSVEPVG